MKKKLSILIYSLANGGAERVVSILLKELSETYDITLVLMNNTIQYNLPENQKIVYLEHSKPTENGLFKLIKLPFLGFKYRQFCQQNGIDITLSFMNRPNYIALFSKLIGNPSKIIISERSQPSLQHKYGLQGLINRTLIKLFYPKADAIIANSLGNTIDLASCFDIDTVHTINNPFDLETIEILSKKDIDLPHKEFTFVTIGRLDNGKNHRLILEAMKNIKAHLWIIGEGPLLKMLEEHIRQLSLEKKVFLLGRQENPFKYLDKADCFVFGSNHEGFPNVLVEALACGLPVISTDCPSGPREILASDTNPNMHLKATIGFEKFGILTPVGEIECMREAMQFIINNPDQKEYYKNNAKIRASDFSKELIIKQFIKILS